MRVTDEMVRRLSDHLKQKVFYGTLNNEARDTKAREFLEVALSHAAGQDGEQCRAASGVEEIARQMDAMAGHIQASSPEQKSERLRGWASMLRALSRGVPEGMVLVPKELTPAMMKAIQTRSEIGAHICGSWTGAYGCIQELWDVAIADQRKGRCPTKKPEGRARCGSERHELDAYIWRRESTQTWVLEISGTINDTSFIARHSEPLSTPPEDVAGLPSLYTTPPEVGGGRGE